MCGDNPLGFSVLYYFGILSLTFLSIISLFFKIRNVQIYKKKLLGATNDKVNATSSN